MKKIIITGICIIGLTSSLLFAENEDLYIYIAKSFTPVPVGWYVVYTKTPSLFTVYSPSEGDTDDVIESYNLTLEYLPRIFTVEEYINAVVEQIKMMTKDFKVHERGSNYHIYEATIGETKVKQLQYFYIKGKIAYILTFGSTPLKYAEYADLFKSIGEKFSLIAE